ncbi:MAG: HNH endonuclease signature motif containing protein [Armatimonadia bacterium]
MPISCAECGKEILVAPGRIRYRQSQYCSKECGRAGQSRKISAIQKPASNWRTLAKRRFGTVCALCGFPHFIEVHHIVPRSKGGGDETDNLIPLCPNHHGMVHANLLATKELRAAQAAAERRQGHLDVTVWNQPA